MFPVVNLFTLMLHGPGTTRPKCAILNCVGPVSLGPQKLFIKNSSYSVRKSHTDVYTNYNVSKRGKPRCRLHHLWYHFMVCSAQDNIVFIIFDNRQQDDSCKAHNFYFLYEVMGVLHVDLGWIPWDNASDLYILLVFIFKTVEMALSWSPVD